LPVEAPLPFLPVEKWGRFVKNYTLLSPLASPIFEEQAEQ
jgi:hypothetical protein